MNSKQIQAPSESRSVSLRLRFLATDDVDIRAKRWEKLEEFLRRDGDRVEESARQPRQHLAFTADEIASVHAFHGVAVPFHELAQVANDRLAYVAAENRVTLFIPFVQPGEIRAAEDHVHALADIHRVGCGQNQQAAGSRDAGDFTEQPA